MILMRTEASSIYAEYNKQHCLNMELSYAGTGLSYEAIVY